MFSLFKVFLKFFSYVYVVCTCVCRCLWKPVKDARHPRVWVTGDCELSVLQQQWTLLPSWAICFASPKRMHSVCSGSSCSSTALHGWNSVDKDTHTLHGLHLSFELTQVLCSPSHMAAFRFWNIWTFHTLMYKSTTCTSVNSSSFPHAMGLGWNYIESIMIPSIVLVCT